MTGGGGAGVGGWGGARGRGGWGCVLSGGLLTKKLARKLTHPTILLFGQA